MLGELETEERKQRQNRNVLRRREQCTVRSIGLEPPRQQKA
jgi:hypothetical protein